MDFSFALGYTVGLFIVISLAIAVYQDSRRRGEGVANSMSWAICTILCAIITVPMYLMFRVVRRER